MIASVYICMHTILFYVNRAQLFSHEKISNPKTIPITAAYNGVLWLKLEAMYQPLQHKVPQDNWMRFRTSLMFYLKKTLKSIVLFYRHINAFSFIRLIHLFTPAI